MQWNVTSVPSGKLTKQTSLQVFFSIRRMKLRRQRVVPAYFYLRSVSDKGSPLRNTSEPWIRAGGPQDPLRPDKRSMEPSSVDLIMSLPAV